MAIIPYEKNGQTCYRIRCVSTSRTNRKARVQRQIDLGAVSLKDAKIEHARLKREVEAARLQRERNQITWRELLKAWYRRDVMECTLPTSTKIDNYRTLLRYTKDWMEIPVDQLNPMSVQIIFNDMEKEGLSRGRMKSVKGAINVVFEWGMLNKLLPLNLTSPAKGAKLPKGESEKQPVLNREEIRLLLQKAQEFEHEYYPVWAMAFLTGCRSGELWALQWTDVDFDRKIISVRKSYNSRLKVIKSTKTGRWRDVPINPQLETLLKELKLRTAHTGYVLPRITSWKRGEAASILRDFCRIIGVREIHLHATRSCFAVLCLESGQGIATTMKLGGWSEVKSFQHYVRLSATEIRGTTDRLDLLPSPPGTATVHELKPKAVEVGS